MSSPGSSRPVDARRIPTPVSLVLDRATLVCSRCRMASGDASGLERCIGWYSGDTGVATDPDQHCLTRDVFEGRLTRVLALCEKRGYDANESALLTTVVSEIGNNSLDHNLGQWIDTPGCWFGYSVEDDTLVWIADGVYWPR